MISPCLASVLFSSTAIFNSSNSSRVFLRDFFNSSIMISYYCMSIFGSIVVCNLKNPDFGFCYPIIDYRIDGEIARYEPTSDTWWLDLNPFPPPSSWIFEFLFYMFYLAFPPGLIGYVILYAITDFLRSWMVASWSLERLTLILGMLSMSLYSPGLLLFGYLLFLGVPLEPSSGLWSLIFCDECTLRERNISGGSIFSS